MKNVQSICWKIVGMIDNLFEFFFFFKLFRLLVRDGNEPAVRRPLVDFFFKKQKMRKKLKWRKETLCFCANHKESGFCNECHRCVQLTCCSRLAEAGVYRPPGHTSWWLYSFCFLCGHYNRDMVFSRKVCYCYTKQVSSSGSTMKRLNVCCLSSKCCCVWCSCQ